MPHPKESELAETKARLQQAVAEYKKWQNKLQKSKSSLWHVTKNFNVSRQTLAPW